MTKIDDRLLKGYQKFRDTVFESDRARYEQLAQHGQKPHTLVITCSDSRVMPQDILSAGPGELFMVRNVAAQVPPLQAEGGSHSAAAAIEYAVTALGVSNIVVMGHTACGGVASVVDKSLPEESSVHKWMQPLHDWYDHCQCAESGNNERKEFLEKASVQVSINRLKEFPFVAERIQDGTLTLHGLLFNIETGELSKVTDAGEGRYELETLTP